MGNKTTKKQSIITAESARKTAKYTTKVKHIISRNIKEAAEMGMRMYVYVGENLQLGVSESIEYTFKDCGFNVDVTHECSETMSTESGVKIYTSDYTYFVFSW